jgi:signal peptidase II
MLFFGIVLAVALVDQISKAVIRGMLPAGKNIEVIPHFFYIWHVNNTGAGFSLLKDQNSILIWVSLIIIGAIIYNYDKIIGNNWHIAAFSLIIGGAVGNLIDRIFQGFVTDFLDFYFIFDYWPAFNMADSAITIGAIMLVITLFFNSEKCKKESEIDKTGMKSQSEPI